MMASFESLACYQFFLNLSTTKNEIKKNLFFFRKKIKFIPNFFLHISSSYAEILGEKLFRTWEFPRGGSKAEDGGKRKKENLRELGHIQLVKRVSWSRGV